MEEKYNEFIGMIHEFKRTIGKLKSTSLTSAEFMTLLTIQYLSTQNKEKGNHYGVKVSDIAQKLETSKPDISKKIRLLEEKELVERLESAQDKRVTYIRITKKGSGILLANKQKADRFLNNVFERMGEEEMLAFTSLCQKMREAMEEEIKATTNGKGKGGNEENI